jgi:hypothetical protein
MDRILVDGFPRSGNTFCNNVLVKSFPDAWVSSFTHSAKVLTKEHFVLIRNPQKAISSFMSVFREPDADASERWWVRFYDTAVKETDVKRWIFFEDLVSDTQQVVDTVGNITNITPMSIDYGAISKNSALEPYPLHLFNKAQKFYEELKREAGK